jgi:UDP-N-acetylglucosamine diphosphorylase / glucose-1-phosphate thymidylyltransferase / UDP-N-acetylgalactosamine diphosphorylase / glucosamine-1-phosphate N-acetyltransferase / galactosamine-1-phosphate N-acetyltransferase
MKGILLAAGKGARLRPLTDHTPKPLLPVGGKPILQWIIEGLEKSGIRDLAIVVGHLSEQIIRYFNEGSQFNVRIRYFHQTVMDGTARAVLPAADFILNEPFFLGYGDVLVDPSDYETFFRVHRTCRQDSLVAGWASETPWTGGVLVQQNGRLVDLVEKPHPGTEPGNIINAGLMVLQPEIFNHLRQVKPSVRGEFELTDALLSLAGCSIVRVHTLESFWSDIGTFDKLAETDRYFQKHYQKQ